MTKPVKLLPKHKRPDPETVIQAQTWDRNASRYRAAGFCDRCAAQASWGHQLGFNNVKPVNDCCRGKTAAGQGQRAARWALGGIDVADEADAA